MKNDRRNGSCWLSIVGCLRNTKGLPFSYLPTLAFAIVLTLLVTPFLSAQQRWERNYGGDSTDYGYSVQQTSDGGFIVAGVTNSFGDSTQVYLIKTNASGDTLWTRTYGGRRRDQGFSVQQTTDGGYIVGGMTESFGAGGGDFYLIKTDSNGDTLWTRTYGGQSNEVGYSVRQTQDEGYIMTGWTITFGSGNWDFYLVKTNAAGDTLWTRTYGGSAEDLGRSVQQTRDGGYIVAGETESYGAGWRDFYVVKTNAYGDTLWTRTYGGISSEECYSVSQTQDGGYILAGNTNSFGAGGADFYLVKTDGNGNTLWTRTYGGANNDFGTSVQQTSNGGYIVAGETYSFGNGYNDVYLIKTSSSGDTLWTRTYGGTSSDNGWSVQQNTDGGYVIAGGTYSFGNAYQVYLIKTDANGNVGIETERGKGFEGSRVHGFKVNPNPFISFASVPGQEKETFDLYDITGRKVGTNRGDRVGANLPAGVYFLRTPGKTSTPLRIVKVR
jgi:hypothetical protein